MYTSLAFAAVLAATASAFDCSGPYFSFYNRGGQAMSYQRLDPALFPGTQSPHLHSFDGGNALTETMGFDTTQESTCTTARIKPDKSLYWRPTLFWNGNNTGYYRVPEQFTKIYYKFGDAGNEKASVSEFPEGFRMIAGDPFKRSDDGNNPGGIKWSCMSDSGRIDTVGFPKGFTSCNQGFATEITFPACWNGNDMDPKNPSDHMAYPTNNGKGIDACPDGFKKARFPTIFIEFWYDIKSFDGQYGADDVPWVLAQGDPTGLGWHADFLNGWEKGVLAKATADEGYCNCGCGCGNDQMKQCFGAENVNDDGDADFKSCSASPLYGGDAGTVLDKLPGCNPIQSGPSPATVVTGEGCTAGPVSNGGASTAAATPSPSASAAQSSQAVSSVQVQDVSSALPILSFSLGNTQSGGGYGGYVEPTPSTLESSIVATPASSTHYEAPTTPEASSSIYTPYTPTGISDGGSLGLVFSDIATNPPSWELSTLTDYVPPVSLATTASPAESTPAGGAGGCKPPVYVTITPTVYVTVGGDTANNSTPCAPTVYETVTNVQTVTVPAGGYKHKRHADLHKL